MTRPIHRTPAAQQDLRETVGYLASISPAIASKFLDRFRDACEKIAGAPNIGSRFEFRDERLREIRIWPVPRFRNYLIFYAPEADHIRIIRVLHAAREWQEIVDVEM